MHRVKFMYEECEQSVDISEKATEKLEIAEGPQRIEATQGNINAVGAGCQEMPNTM